MTSFQQLDKVVDFVFKHRLPNKTLIYCENEDDLKNKLLWVHDLCASGITSCSFATGEIETSGASKIIYRGHEFWYINIEKL